MKCRIERSIVTSSLSGGEGMVIGIVVGAVVGVVVGMVAGVLSDGSEG
ncbi:MAG TPA: hypothetical protein VE134_10175 [Methanomicrobiales archaeon]|nr:hypothetical protein [Methanomicrobiales archaeon]